MAKSSYSAGVLMKVNFLLVLLLTVVLGADAQQQMNAEPPDSEPTRHYSKPEMPVFRSEARQVLVGATVWRSSESADTGTITRLPNGLPKATEEIVQRQLGLIQPVRGLRPEDLRLFDNDVPQILNYFREIDFSAKDANQQWFFTPTTHGLWGQFVNASAALNIAQAFYLIGYVPPALAPGECHQLRAAVDRSNVRLTRSSYCQGSETNGVEAALAPNTKLGETLRNFASSPKHASIQVSGKAFAFRSSAVLRVSNGALPLIPIPSSAAPEFTFIVNVHDTSAPARVAIAVEFSSEQLHWQFGDGRAYLSLYVLGLVYDREGKLVREFGDTYRGERLFQMWRGAPTSMRPTRVAVDDNLNTIHSVILEAMPSRYDTQVELPPGTYDICIVVSDGGKNFGYTHVPVRVERFRPAQLSVSDIIVTNIVRSASQIFRDEIQVFPSALVPTPLMSADSEFFPAATNQFGRHSPVSVYFEIYEPLLDRETTEVSIAVRITDLKGRSVRDLGPINAGTWARTGSVVIPVGFELGTESLHKGSYRVGIQAVDSAGSQTDWRYADFLVK